MIPTCRTTWTILVVKLFVVNCSSSSYILLFHLRVNGSFHSTKWPFKKVSEVRPTNELKATRETRKICFLLLLFSTFYLILFWSDKNSKIVLIAIAYSIATWFVSKSLHLKWKINFWDKYKLLKFDSNYSWFPCDVNNDHPDAQVSLSTLLKLF